jgi:hypothetical protein
MPSLVCSNRSTVVPMSASVARLLRRSESTSLWLKRKRERQRLMKPRATVSASALDGADRYVPWL